MRINKGIDMVRVSGVPYEVDLPSNDDIIATLEHENNCLRARNERLEEEFKDLDQENDFLRSKIKLLES
jgi:cell division protein FtsB